ncbi:iron-containing alcohol dehydrogenase [Chitinophaga agrisoli]|uniref:Iron-containing alcohol dehydrogenase n=1 Tax=Chitinophaga agrisoli TaxID=2607653 RepID=A0A5B2VRT6_9BACT|nr:iron-containing alcohol dehydrogenase [Chitinophaga agrisoli]KAA2241330.1 iron-containing alcohol dehydrogenase [Chitinophaga agrisoli]
MNSVTIINPAKLVFGEKSFEQFVTDYIALGLQRLYIVSIPPVIAQISDALKTLQQNGVTIAINGSIAGEPSFNDFEKLLQEARDFEADSVVGIGGGSVMDAAKLVAAQLKNTQTTAEVIGIRNLKQRTTYMACIPTTSGTGSEVSPNALFVDDTGAKVGVISPFLVPDAAYIDPALTVSLPASVTASTGIDALTHCLEAYANNFAHPVIDLIALEGVRLVAKYLRRACENGNDMEARSQVALGSMYGGMCLGPVNTAAVHALSYPLGVSYHIPHGLSIALLLPYVMEFNLSAAPARYAQLALALGAEPGQSEEETARRGIMQIRRLIRDCQLPASLEELNIPYDSIDKMAEDALKIQRLLKNNVRVLTQQDAADIYRAAFNKVYESSEEI